MAYSVFEMYSERLQVFLKQIDWVDDCLWLMSEIRDSSHAFNRYPKYAEKKIRKTFDLGVAKDPTMQYYHNTPTIVQIVLSDGTEI